MTEPTAEQREAARQYVEAINLGEMDTSLFLAYRLADREAALRKQVEELAKDNLELIQAEANEAAEVQELAAYGAAMRRALMGIYTGGNERWLKDVITLPVPKAVEDLEEKI